VRFAKPEEIAVAIPYLMGAQSSYVTGRVMVVGGGENIFAV
jgi:NAD(P)-dependent dehydrogenase (short-subunit alcohol dehydrogenase family)